MIFANTSADTNRSRKQAFSNQLVEQKRRGRTLPAIVNGLTASQAQAQGFVEDDSQDEDSSYVSSRRSSISKEETLFLPNGSTATESGQELLADGRDMAGPKAQDSNPSEAGKWKPFSQLSPPSSTSSELPKPDVPTPTSIFGSPTAWSPSRATNRLFPPPTFSGSGTSNSPKTNNQPDSSSTSFDFSPHSEATSGPFGTPERPDSTTPAFDATKLNTSQTQTNSTPTVAPARSIFDLKSPSTNTIPKFSFATSPLFSQYDKTNDASQAETNDANFAFPPRPSFQAGKPHQSEQKTPESPLKFLNQPPSSSTATSFTPVVKAPDITPAPTQDLPRSTAQRPFSSLFPPTTRLESTSTPSANRSNTSATNLNLLPTQPTATNLNASSTQTDNVTTSSQQSLFPVALGPPRSTAGTQPTGASPPTISPFVPKSPQSAVVAPAPSDPGPAVLDTLAERLMMDDGGLLQQFIEYKIGPIVHAAFREIQEEISWNRASQSLIANFTKVSIKQC